MPQMAEKTEPDAPPNCAVLPYIYFFICCSAAFSSRETCAWEMPIFGDSIWFSLKEPPADDAPSLLKALKRLSDGQIAYPVVLVHPLVAKLIHHIDRVAPAVLIDRVEQRHGILNGLQRQHHILLGHVHLLGDLPHRRIAPQPRRQRVPGFQRAIGRVPHGARHADGVVVPEIPEDFADDHGHAVGAQAHVHAQIKIVQPLHQPDAAHLKQIVHVFAAVLKALNHAQHQPQIGADELLARRFVARMRPLHQRAHGLMGQNGQLRRVHAANFNLVSGHVHSLHCCKYCRSRWELFRQKKPAPMHSEPFAHCSSMR